MKLFLCARQFRGINSFHPHKTLYNMYCSYQVEAQRGSVACPGPHGLYAAELGFEPRQLGSWVCAHDHYSPHPQPSQKWPRRPDAEASGLKDNGWRGTGGDGEASEEIWGPKRVQVSSQTHKLVSLGWIDHWWRIPQVWMSETTPGHTFIHISSHRGAYLFIQHVIRMVLFCKEKLEGIKVIAK